MMKSPAAALVAGGAPPQPAAVRDATYHGIVAGTDHGNTAFRLAALASVNVIAFLTVVLILASRRSAVATIKADERHRQQVGAL